MTSRSVYVYAVYPRSVPYNSGHNQNFLAGPIGNAPPWHEDAIDILCALAKERGSSTYLRINCPKHEKDMVRTLPVNVPPTGISYTHNRQRAWELDTQEASVFDAGILFWLPKQGGNKFPEKVYGAMTQLEIGYWLARASADKRLRIAFGTDGVYNGELHTIVYDIERLAPHLLPIHNSLESLCARSMAWVDEGWI